MEIIPVDGIPDFYQLQKRTLANNPFKIKVAAFRQPLFRMIVYRKSGRIPVWCWQSMMISTSYTLLPMSPGGKQSQAETERGSRAFGTINYRRGVRRCKLYFRVK